MIAIRPRRLVERRLEAGVSEVKRARRPKRGSGGAGLLR